jgi:hypothetical protein
MPDTLDHNDELAPSHFEDDPVRAHANTPQAGPASFELRALLGIVADGVDRGDHALTIGLGQRANLFRGALLTDRGALCRAATAAPLVASEGVRSRLSRSCASSSRSMPELLSAGTPARSGDSLEGARRTLSPRPRCTLAAQHTRAARRPRCRTGLPRSPGGTRTHLPVAHRRTRCRYSHRPSSCRRSPARSWRRWYNSRARKRRRNSGNCRPARGRTLRRCCTRICTAARPSTSPRSGRRAHWSTSRASRTPDSGLARPDIGTPDRGSVRSGLDREPDTRSDPARAARRFGTARAPARPTLAYRRRSQTPGGARAAGTPGGARMAGTPRRTISRRAPAASHRFACHRAARPPT